ncbi:MAG: transporter substrate-binding domain-containing protein [Anaerolineaceae bacterium]|nr:transporter substrate-binding domain-containing protein [Anaerolineaceae bacterium]
MLKKSLLFLMIAVMLLSFAAVSADDLSNVKAAGVLRFGAPMEYIPFVFEDQSGSSSGMDIALMEEVCRRMGVRLQKLSFARDGMIDALNLGQLDVIGGGLSKTDARAQRIDFTRTYYNGEAVFISLTSTVKPQTVSLESFRGMKVAVVKGSSFQDWIQNNLVNTNIIPLANVFTFSDSADGIKAMERKDVDLVIIDQDVFDSRYRGTGKYQVFYSGFNTENYAFGVRKGSTLTEVINNHLVDMLRDGTAQNIANKFFTMDFSQKDAAIQKPVATLAPIATAAPSAANCVNAMSYVADVTVKDGTVYSPNYNFRKTWRIYNNGSCTWDSNYTLQFVSGDNMNGGYVRIPTTVKPGQTVDISADLRSPAKAGTYKGNWQMRSPQGQGFGQTIWVSIRVDGSAPAPTARPSDGQKRVIPVINYFYAADTEGFLGDWTTIYWSVSNGAGVTITCDGNTIENSAKMTGSAMVSAVLQKRGIHEIKLTAHSVTDDVSSSIYYTMYDENGETGEGQTQIKPSIDYFYADSDSGHTGDSVVVYWGTTNASGVTLSVDGYNIVNSTADGSYQLQAPVSGAGTHSITLTAQSVTDSSSQTIYYTTYDWTVDGGGSRSGGDDGQTEVIPSVNYVYISPDSGYTGDAAYLYWDTSNAIGVTITVDGYTIDNSGPSGSYTLQAPISGVGSHTITVTAHSVTSDASSSCTYTSMERSSSNDSGGYDGGGGWTDTSGNGSSEWTDTSQSESYDYSWDDSGSSEEYNISEDEINAMLETLTDTDWAALELLVDEGLW